MGRKRAADWYRVETKTMKESVFTGRTLLSETAILVYLALFKLLLHFFTNGRYGYFRDELYYIACGEHLDWGYVDQSPLIGLVAAATRSLFGDSLFALRLFPAIAGACLVFLTGLIARELGGGRFAQAFAALACIIIPLYLYMHTVLTMNAFEPLFWMLCAYIVIRIMNGGSPRLWLLFGATAGLGLMNKHSMALFGFALVAGLLLTPARRWFLERWIWLGGVIALLIFLPHIIWQIVHEWPMIEILRNAAVNQNLPISPLEFFAGQILLIHPANLLVWVAGLFFFLFTEQGKRFRALGWTYLVMFLLCIALKAKVYYLAPAYPMLLAAGAVVVERLASRLRWRWLKPATATALVVAGAILAPLTLPVLPIETFIRYSRALGLGEGVRTEQNSIGRLPQHYADMFGWEEMTAAVARAYHSLSPEERARCAIFADNYGEAGAIDFFGARHGLPRAISGHQNYFLWGPRDYTGEVMIFINSDLEDLQAVFESVEPAGTFTNEYVMPYENNLTIYVCRRPRMPLTEFWPRVKCYSC